MVIIMKKVLIVGGGPAGMMAAIMAAHNGAQVTLLEKKEKVGKKLAITGKGRCNLTTAVEREYLIAGYPGQGRFLYSAFNELSNFDLIELFESWGLKTKIERGHRVFPQSDNAADVVKVLYDNVINSGVEVIIAKAVTEIIISANEVQGISTGGKRVAADAIIIATGGLSYPGTGSTGDGYKWACQAGHNIIEPRPGLVPLIAEEAWVRELQGLSLKNVRATAWDEGGRKINEEFGEMLFTHFGLSGPIILTMSRDIGTHLYNKEGPVHIQIDLKPALDEEKMDERLQRDFSKYSRRQFNNGLDDLLPHKLIPVMVALSGIDPEKACNQLTRSERKGLAHLFKNLPVTISGTRPVAEAIVTAGGVAVSQVNPRTMESKLVKGLYFAGEILDVDGYTGGFNLQAAFSTGYVAGKHAALE